MLAAITMSKEIQGEGDYEAANRYREGIQRFEQAGKIEDAAKDAAPHTDAEARELAAAEKSGLARRRGDDSADVGIMYEQQSAVTARNDAATAERAYQLWQSGCSSHGSADADWYEAERQLRNPTKRR